MKYLYFLFILVFLTSLSSCDNKSPDEIASEILSKSREHLYAGRYDAARDSIISMRKKYPTAINVRAQGILLLDSIEMMEAKDSLGCVTGEEWKRLSMKVRFFERKLKEDKKKLSL